MESMEQKTQLVNVVLFTDQIRWMNKRNLNLSEFVQDSMDEWMYEDPDKEVRKEIDKRRMEKIYGKGFLRLKKGKKEYHLSNRKIIADFLKSHYYKDYKNGKSLEKCVDLSIIATEGLVSICEQSEFDELLIEVEREVSK